MDVHQKWLQGVYPAIIMADGEGRIIFSNKSACEILSVQEKDLLKQKLSDYLPDKMLHDALVKGIPVQSIKLPIDKKVFLANINPVFEAGKLMGAVCFFQDIAGIAPADQEIESISEVARELEAIFNSSYDEIFVTDGRGITLRVNEAGMRYYGVEAHEIIGKHVSELEEQGFFSPSVTPMVLKERKRVTSIQRTKEGQTLIVTSNPVFDEKGNIIRIVTNSRDITELTNLRQRLEEVEKLKDIYRIEIAKLRQERLGAAEVISASPTMEHVLDIAEKVANVNSTVLIQGESGVGKGVIAYRIHQLSKRREGPFITINCGAIPENLMESELFGYEEGAFTGAKKGGKKGLVELANGGTVFFDEVSELPLSLQVKLLTVIQDKKIMRVGGGDYVDIDIRIIVATNRNIQELVKENKFREDLFYRLNVVPITVPPLRYRKEDIFLLADYFVNSFCEKYELQKSFSVDAKEKLALYGWPGNVRELENLVERLLVTVDSAEILPGHLPEYILHADGGTEKVFVAEICHLKNAIEEVERQLLKKALAKYKNTYRMAEALGVNQSTVVRKMHQHQIIKEKKDEWID